ncbi:MAG: ketoacyl-ACP synthase III [Spirochaetes bacterium]|nr:ketoacyl-ACP synthase III [Spirochaetota bacterium]MBU1079606.1 ketoacyl-ACP synthase III [Spirochaetota bacterium]
MAKAKIVGTGLYAPGEPIGNEELKRLAGVEFDSERLEEKVGIKARHIARLRGIDESAADFAEKAARAAIADAGIGPMDVDLVVVGTDTPEYVSPATAILVQGRLQGGQRDTGAFDVGASCASFVTALDATAMMMAGDRSLRFAVVVGVYNMPAHVRPGDAFGWSIFADGAGAVVLARVDDADPSGYVTGKLISDGTQWDYVGVYAGGARKPVTRELLDAGTYGLELLQRLPGDRNVKLWPPVIRALCDKGGIPLERVSRFVLTQINKSVIESVMDALERPRDLAPTVMDRYGYTGSGCVPMAFHHAVKDGLVARGDPVAFCASGAGFAVGANLFIY